MFFPVILQLCFFTGKKFCKSLWRQIVFSLPCGIMGAGDLAFLLVIIKSF